MKNKKPRRFSLTTFLLALTAAVTALPALAVADPQPKACVGFDPLTEHWGWLWTTVTPDRAHLCPPNYAFYGVHTPAVRFKRPAPGVVQGNCCPLPADDILTNEHLYVERTCPEGFVLTGGPADLTEDGSPQNVRCTKINAQRYALGPAEPGAFWGESVSVAFPWKEPRIFTPNILPVAIRYGVRRETRTYFSASGCVGTPVGSLLISIGAHRCGTYLFRTLRRNDPAGSPVPMFPNCSALTNIFDPAATCTEKEQPRTND